MQNLNVIETKKVKNNSIFSYILVILITCITESLVLTYGGSRGYYIKMYLPVIMAAVAFCIYLIRYDAKTDNNFMIMCLVIAFIGVSSLQGSSPGVTLSYLSILLFAIVFVRIYPFEKFAELYSKIIFAMSVLSIILYLFVWLDLPMLSKIPVMNLINASTKEVSSYYTLYFANVGVNYFGGFPRGMGVFWEPGLFQAYLCLAIILELFWFKRKGANKALYIIVFTVALFTTMSTAGFINYALIMAYYVMAGYKNSKHPFLSILGVLVLVGIPVYLLTMDEELYMKVFGKLMEENRGGSFESRAGSLIGNIKVFLNNPVLGAGYGGSTRELQNIVGYMSGGEHIHQTNTFTNYFASFGAVIGCVFMVAWYRLAKAIAPNKFGTFVLFLIFFSMTSSENLLPSLFFNTLVMYGFSNMIYNGKGVKISESDTKASEG